MNDIYTTQINESIASLFANMEKRISAEDMQRVRDAYALAAKAHKEQRRKTEEERRKTEEERRKTEEQRIRAEIAEQKDVVLDNGALVGKNQFLRFD